MRVNFGFIYCSILQPSIVCSTDYTQAGGLARARANTLSELGFDIGTLNLLRHHEESTRTSYDYLKFSVSERSC